MKANSANAAPLLINRPGTTLLINGVDYSEYLVEGSAQRTAIQEQSGLIFTSGQLVLADYVAGLGVLPGLSELRLKDSGNLRIGNQIEVSINGQIAQIVNKLNILSAEIDERAGQIRLNLGCALTIANNLQPATLASCTDFNEGTLLSTVLINVLGKAGLSSRLSLSGLVGNKRLVRPLYLDENQAFIQLAGQIAASLGYCLYQNHEGLIKAVSYLNDTSSNGLTLSASQLYNLELTSIQEYPPSRMVCEGTINTYDVFPTSTERDVNSTADTFSETVKTTDFDQRKVEFDSITYAKANKVSPTIFGADDDSLVFAEAIREDSFYKKEKGQKLDECTEVDEAYLDRKVTKKYYPKAKALEAYYQQQAEFLKVNPATLNISSNQILSELEEVEFSADFPETKIRKTYSFVGIDNPQALAGQLGNIEAGVQGEVYIVRTKRELKGAVFPLIGKPDLGRGTVSPGTTAASGVDVLVTSPNDLILTELEIKRYTLGTDKRTWTLRKQLWVNTYRLKPESIDPLIFAKDSSNNYIHSLRSIVNKACSLQQVENRTTFNTSVENPERLNPLVVQESIPFEHTVVRLDSPVTLGNLTRIESYQVNPEFTNLSMVGQIGTALLKRQWQRFKSRLISLPLPNNPDTLDTPLAPIKVFDYTRGEALVLALDAAGIQFNKRECLIGGNGLLVKAKTIPVKPIASSSSEITAIPSEDIADLDNNGQFPIQISPPELDFEVRLGGNPGITFGTNFSNLNIDFGSLEFDFIFEYTQTSDYAIPLIAVNLNDSQEFTFGGDIPPNTIYSGTEPLRTINAGNDYIIADLT